MKFKRILVTGGSGFIGTNLLEHLQGCSNVSISSIDLVEPKIKRQLEYWQSGDLRNQHGLRNAIQAFEPDAIIHLAARTDLDGRVIDDYSSNTIGASNLLEALDAIGYRGPAIFTSSMYVCRPGHRPRTDTDYQPHTVYGESKVIGEQLVRRANPEYPWIITRPTSIWGPWFGIPYIHFFQMVLARRYFHIAGDRTCKTYGYVGNTIAQMLAILENAEQLRGRTLYLGDWPETVIGEWADELAGFVPYRVPRVPLIAFKTLAVAGDTLKRVGLKFPMTSFRLGNLTTNNVHDLSPLRGLMQELPFTRKQGNELTVQWMRASKP